MSILVSSAGTANRTPMLRVRQLCAFYGELQALHDINVELDQGDVLALIGVNGAGKSTLLQSIVGLLNQGASAHITGAVEFSGVRVESWPPHRVVDAGMTLVPEGRRLFARLSVEDNLLTGAYLRRHRAQVRTKLAEIYELFPKLGDRRKQIVSQMSGGEQQMVAIGRALMSSPKLIAFDELSLGLSPAMVDEIYANLKRIIAHGTTSIIVEQDLKRALSSCNRFCVMSEGRIVLQGRPGEVDENAITEAYFGTSKSAQQHEVAHGAHDARVAVARKEVRHVE